MLSPQTHDGFTTQFHDRQLFTIMKHAGYRFRSPCPAPASMRRDASNALFVMPLREHEWGSEI